MILRANGRRSCQQARGTFEFRPGPLFHQLLRNRNRASQIVWVPLLNMDRFIDDPKLSSQLTFY